MTLANSADWLLFIDNATPSIFRQFIPAMDSGHILVTSVNPNWLSLTPGTFRLSGLELNDATDMLLGRSRPRDPDSATRLAIALDAMPLALEQVAAYVEQSDISLPEYETLLDQHRSSLLSRPSPFTDYTESVYSVFQLTVERLRSTLPYSDALLAYASLMDSISVPKWLLEIPLRNLIESKGEQYTPLMFLDSLAGILAYSLAVSEDEYVLFHPLVQLFILDSLEDDLKHQIAAFLLNPMTYVYPQEIESSATWSQHADLINHVTSILGHTEITSLNDAFDWSLLNRPGLYLQLMDRHADAERVLGVAYDVAQVAFPFNSVQVATARSNLASVLADLDQVAKAIELLEESISILESLPRHDRQVRDTLGRCYSNRGGLALRLGDNERALALFGRAKGIHQADLGRNHFSTGIDINNIGTVYRELKDWPKAYRFFAQAVEIHREQTDGDSYRLSISLFNLATAAFNMGHVQEAANLLREALSFQEQLGFSVDHSEFISTVVGLATVLHQQGYFYEALSLYRIVIPVAEARYGLSDLRTGQLLMARGEAAVKAILPLISPVGAKWSFLIPLLGPIQRMIDGNLAIAAPTVVAGHLS